jgi:hypothetical protein
MDKRTYMKKKENLKNLERKLKAIDEMFWSVSRPDWKPLEVFIYEKPIRKRKQTK